MKKNAVKYILFLTAITLLSFPSFGQKDFVVNGEADIQSFNLHKQVLDLKGTWEFYKNQLYNPEDFKRNNTVRPEYYPVPGLWNTINKNKNTGGIGYGTYRLQILHTQKDKIYGLNLNRVQSSYKIWINNKLIKKEGEVGINKKSSKPKWSSLNIFFKASGDTTLITLQVSNFYHKKGGIENAVLFADADTISEYTWNRSAWNILLLGILLIMAAYHFAAFLFRKNDKSNLYFSLTLIFSAVFSTTVGEILLPDLLPSLNWEILIKTNYISNYLRLLFFSLFIYYAFPKELNKLYFKILTFIITAVIIFILATPAIIYTKTLIVFLVLTGITLIYIIFGQIKAIIRKRPGAIYSFAGVIVLIATAVNDILKEMQVIDSVSLTIFGIFIFIIFHSYLITLQNAYSYKVIKRITKNIGIRSKVKNALFSANSYDLKEPLKAISQVIDTDRSLIFTYTDNDWIAANEYLKKTDTTNKVQIKIFSGKEHIYFSSFNVKKTISSQKPVYTVVNEAVKARDMKYLEGSGIRSILSYPLIKDGIVQGLLYFENYRERKKFDKFTIEILEEIKPQILVFMDNYTSYNDLTQLNIKLEKEVEYKIKEIETRTEELKTVRTKLEKQNAQIFETSQKLKKQTEQINDGINYSEKIQKALLLDKTQFQNLFPNSFIWHKTSGKLISTFYWFHQITKTKIICASVNSHGSDVSSTLISILMNQLFNDIIIYKQNYSPKIILNYIQENFEIYNENIGAVDTAIFLYDKEKQEVLYSGANNSLFYSYENHLIEYKSSAESLESLNNNLEKQKHFFSNKRINIQPGAKIFVCSGNSGCRKNTEEGLTQKKELLNLLIHISDFDNSKVSDTLSDFFNTKLTGDILITGIKF